MGLRFRKGVRLLPGVRLNISKQGISSLSIGGKGLTYNIGKKGTRGTIGMPGTGLSYSKYDKYDKSAVKTETVVDHETGEITQQPIAAPVGITRYLVPAFIALIIGAIYFLRS